MRDVLRNKHWVILFLGVVIFFLNISSVTEVNAKEAQKGSVPSSSLFSLETNREYAMEMMAGKKTMKGASISPAKFLSSIANPAIKNTKKFRLYTSVMMAQAALESGWGSSELTKKGHNLFGVKGSYKGKSVKMKTKEYDAKTGEWKTVWANFKKYPSYLESLEDNGKLLRNGPSFNSHYYSGAWLENAATYQQATKALTGKYATDPNYNSKLNKLIQQYKLTNYENFEIGKNVKALNKDATIVSGDKQGLWSDVPRTVHAKRLAKTAKAYQEKKVKLIRQGSTSSFTYYKFQVNGKTIGWVDKRAFHVYETGHHVKALNKDATIVSGDKQGLWSDVPRTVHAKRLAKTAKAYQEKKVKLIRQGSNSSFTYYKFQVNGKTIGWVDKRAFAIKK